MASIDEVREYWNRHPLLSHELSYAELERFFVEFDRIKRADSDRYALDYWNFEGFVGKRLLDVGCGPGWLAVNYALGGAEVWAMDLTPKAVEIAGRHLEFRQAKAHVREGNAEAIPFADGFFDVVVSSGVLHHTPDTRKAIGECWRVLRPGGTARITLYRRGLLHSRWCFPLLKLAMRVLAVKHPGADLARTAGSVDDFIRQYDGVGNPVGIAKSNRDWGRILEEVGFRVVRVRNHYFPRRFLPFGVPEAVHRFLDRRFGTMAYFALAKLDPRSPGSV